MKVVRRWEEKEEEAVKGRGRVPSACHPSTSTTTTLVVGGPLPPPHPPCSPSGWASYSPRPLGYHLTPFLGAQDDPGAKEAGRHPTQPHRALNSQPIEMDGMNAPAVRRNQSTGPVYPERDRF